MGGRRRADLLSAGKFGGCGLRAAASRVKVGIMEDEEAEFSVDQADEDSILVTHRAEAHRYAYFITKEGEKRILGDNVTIGNNGTLNDATVFGADARAFAEAEARKRNLID
jgi:hypothetical protein